MLTMTEILKCGGGTSTMTWFVYKQVWYDTWVFTFPTCSSNWLAGGSMWGSGLLLSRTSARSNLTAPSMCCSRYSWCASRFHWGKWKVPGNETYAHTFQFYKSTCKIMYTSSPALKQLTSRASHEDTPYRKRTLLTEAVHVSVSLL